MAQVFPLNAPVFMTDTALSVLLNTLAALPDPWTLLAERRIDDSETVGAVLIHPGIGIALVDLAPHDPTPAAAALGKLLARERFAEFFPGELPVVSVSIAAEDIPQVGDRLADAFEGAPLLSIADSAWGDAAIELLLAPSDLAMAPAGGRAEAAPEAAPPRLAEPDFAAADAALPQVEPMVAPMIGAAEPLAAEHPGTALHADWRLAIDEPMPRRRHVPATVLALLLLAGIVGASLAFETGTLPLPVPATALDRQVEAPLTPATATRRVAGPATPAVSHQPPPVPAAAPVMMVAKPLIPPPPSPPKPTRIAALPVVMKPKPVIPPPPPPPKPTRVAALPPAIARPIPPPAAAPAASAEAKPRPPRVTTAEAPPHPRRRVHTVSRREPEPRLRPPIDATDLPPLDAPLAPREHPVATAAPFALAPAESAREPPSPAAEQAVGPPRSLFTAAAPRMQPGTGGEARECRPYTAGSTLSGSGGAVQGIACRGSDGQWRLVSEVPLR